MMISMVNVRFHPFSSIFFQCLLFLFTCSGFRNLEDKVLESVEIVIYQGTHGDLWVLVLIRRSLGPVLRSSSANGKGSVITTMIHLRLPQLSAYLSVAVAIHSTSIAHIIKNSPTVNAPNTVVHVNLSAATTAFSCSVPASGLLYQFSDFPCGYSSDINIGSVAITEDIRCFLRGADTNLTLGQGFPLSTTIETPQSFVSVRCGAPIDME